MRLYLSPVGEPVPLVRPGPGPLYFEIDDGEATLTQGFGGWETVSRPQRVALTRWTGNDPIGQDVPILLDGYAGGVDVEPKLQELLKRSRVRPGAGLPPAVWRLRGPIFYPEKKWIVSGIQFGEILRTPRGENSAALTRQRATISFLEYIDPDQIRIKKIKRRLKPKGKKNSILADGKSIRQIAVEYYGTGEIVVARALGKAQDPPIRDVKKELGKKRKIRLPVLTL